MSTNKKQQYIQSFATLSRHIGQHKVDEVRRRLSTTNTNCVVLNKVNTKEMTSFVNPSTRKSGSTSQMPENFTYSTIPLGVSKDEYKQISKVYFPLFNLYGRPLDIAEFLAEQFIGSLPNVEMFYVGLTTSIIYHYIMETFAKIPPFLKKEDYGISLPVFQATLDFINNYGSKTDEEIDYQERNLFTGIANEFRECFYNALTSVQVNQQKRGMYNALMVQLKAGNNENYGLWNDRLLTGECSDQIRFGVGSLSAFMRKHSGIYFEITKDTSPISLSSPREVIKLIDIPLIGQKTRVLSDVFCRVPSTKSEPYKSERKENVTVVSASFEEKTEIKSVVRYGLGLQNLDHNKAYLLSYAFPLGFNLDHASLNEKHETKGSKLVKNSNIAIYTSLLKRLVSYCLIDLDPKTSSPKPMVFRLLCNAHTGSGGFSFDSSSSEKKYLSFAGVNINVENKDNLSGINLSAKTNNFVSGPVSQDFIVTMNELIRRIEPLAMTIFRYSLYQTSNGVLNKYSASNMPPEIKKQIDPLIKQISDIIEPHITYLYNAFSGHKKGNVTAEIHAEMRGMQNGLAEIHRVVEEHRALAKANHQTLSVSGVSGIASGQGRLSSDQFL